MDELPIQERTGALAYGNWIDVIAGDEPTHSMEFPLFTDAEIHDHVDGWFGPYSIFNTVSSGTDYNWAPALVLRVDYVFKDYVRIKPNTDITRFHGGGLNDEIAALVSLLLGIRVKSGGKTRDFLRGFDPRGTPTALEAHTDPPEIKRPYKRAILPSATGEHSLLDSALLGQFPKLLPEQSIALVRAARLYQDAVWIVESEPSLAWVMLVSSVEAAADHWSNSKETPVEKLKWSYPKLAELLYGCGGDKHVMRVAAMIAPNMGASKKFCEFLLNFKPEAPEIRPPEAFRYSWEKSWLQKSFRKIYDWRSKALHGGIPFPIPMCEKPQEHDGVLDEIPTAIAQSALGGNWLAEDTPMYLFLFEYIARNSLIKWWKSMLTQENQ
jgi:hypothetical protein